MASTGNKIPESLFLRLVPPSNYLTRNANYPRPSDAAIHYHQNPVGWLFFSVNHINQLVAAMEKDMPGIRVEDITPAMLRVYDFYNRDTYTDANDAQALKTALAQMDLALLAEMRAIAARFVSGRNFYGNFLMNPNPRMENAVATSTNNRRTTTINDTKGSVQGGYFDPSTSTSTSNIGSYASLSVQPLIKYA